MIKLFNSISLILLFASCNSENPFVKKRLKTVEKFVECLKNNQSDKILEFTYSGVSENIDNKDLRDHSVAFAYEAIKKHGLPSEKNWIIKYDPKNNFERLEITIPLFKTNDSLSRILGTSIILTFPPPEISDKIYKYEINNIVNMEKFLKEAPVPVNSTKH